MKSWGASEHRAWETLVKDLSIGLELEYRYQLSGQDCNDQKDLNIFKAHNIFCELKHTRMPYYNGNEAECVQIFPLSSPLDLISTIRRFQATCEKYRIPTIGSIHLNVVTKNFLIRTSWLFTERNAEIHQYDDFERISNAKRYECKRFSGYILPSDLLAQMLLYLGAFNYCTEKRDYLAFRAMVIEEYGSLVPQGQQWAQIDLNKVLLSD